MVKMIAYDETMTLYIYIYIYIFGTLAHAERICLLALGEGNTDYICMYVKRMKNVIFIGICSVLY